MKIFFIGSPRDDIEKLKLVYNTIKELGHKHTCDLMDVIDPKSFYDVENSSWEKRYKLRLKQIAMAEACIIDTSIPSIAMGQLFQEAVRQDKATIAIYEKGSTPHSLFGVNRAENRTQIFEYTKETIEEVLKYGLEEAKSLLEHRFTMILSGEIIDYLDDVKKREGISRSEFIRNLIREKMEQR